MPSRTSNTSSSIVASEPIYPFRWDLTRRQQLGRLLDGSVAATYDGFFADLLHASARVLALSGDSDLYFLGRSLESMFDLLSVLLCDTSWADRLQLVHFSSRFANLPRIRTQYPEAIPALRTYLTMLSLHPPALVSRSRQAALIDVVNSGSTLGTFVGQLQEWSRDGSTTWNDAARHLRIVGVTKQLKTSPKTWRWQQHVHWIEALSPSAVKNVSIPERMYRFVADEQRKVSASYPPWRWGRADVTIPRRDAATLEALRLAVKLFNLGQKQEIRAQFARLLTEQPSMKERWLRSLVADLRQ